MRPYLSFVTWGRNDGYTSNYLARVTAATRCLLNQLEREGLDSEIVLSEWNPLPGRPLLIEALDLPASTGHVTVRGVVAGPEFHAKFRGAHERGMQSAEAINVGIRRARGRFVTPKASDTFFTDDVITRLARRDLEPDAVYRVDRYDVSIEDPSVWELECGALLERLAERPSFRHAYLRQVPQWQLRDLHTNACGDFLLMGAGYWHFLRGHPYDDSVLGFDVDSLVMHAAASFGVKECRWPDECKVYKPFHGSLNNARIVPVWRTWQKVLDWVLANKVSVHLSQRARVVLDYPRRRLRGVDSVLGPSVERNFAGPAADWSRGAYPIPTQPENWGLADEPLPEQVRCRAAWDSPATAAPA